MTSSTFEAVSSQLLSASISSGAVAAGVWLACRYLPGLPAAARATLWWLVALKLLVGLVWVAPVSLPVLPTTWGEPASLGRTVALQPPALPVTSAVADSPKSTSAGASLSWSAVVAVVWLAGLAMFTARFGRQLRQSYAVLSRAVPAGAGLSDVTKATARRLGVSDVPELYVSDDIHAPMLVGLRRPRIVVPRERFAALSPAAQRMAVGHELAHHRRGDLWLGLIPALAERVFFFHPLAWLAAREYLVAREAACDAEVIEALDVSAQDYGRLLLALGVAPVQARFAAAGSSRTFSNLKRRIVMLGLPSPTRKVRTAGWAIAALAVCSLVPVRLVGRDVAERVQTGPSTDIALPAPAPESALVAAPMLAQSPERPVVRDRDRLEYALMLSERSTIMSGNIESGQLDALRGSSPRLLWFKIDGRQYVVRDNTAIDNAAEITRPIREIGAAQGAVGSRQGAIGARQGEVGARQGAIGAKQGAVGARQGEIGAKQAALAARETGASESQREQLDRQREALDAEMRKLDDEMRALDDQMREADRPMADLDAQMRVLDDEMRALDQKMHDAEPKVRAALRNLFDRLIAEKVAEPVR